MADGHTPCHQAHSGTGARSLLSVTIPTLASEVSPARWLSQEYGRDFCAKIPAAQVMGRGPTQHQGSLEAEMSSLVPSAETAGNRRTG